MKRRLSTAAFTLMEVVLALALGAMLMASLVGVLRSTDRQLKHAKLPANGESNCDIAFRTVARDLMLAQTIQADEKWITINGSFPDFDGNGSYPAQLRYGIAAQGATGKSVLMRIADNRGQAIAPGVSRIVIERIDARGVPQPLSGQPISLSGVLRIWMWETGSDTPSLERDVVVH